MLGTIHSSFFHAVNTKTFHTLFSTIFPINSFSGRTSLLWTRFLVRIQLLDLSAFQRLNTVWNNIFQYFYNSSEIWLIDMFVWLSSKQRFCFVNFQRDRIERETKRRMSKLQIVNLRDLKQKKPSTLLKKSLWHRCFPVNFSKFLRTTFFTEYPRWLFMQNLTNEIVLASTAWKSIEISSDWSQRCCTSNIYPNFPKLTEEAVFFVPDLVTFTEEILNGKLHFLCKTFLDWYRFSKLVEQNDTREYIWALNRMIESQNF